MEEGMEARHDVPDPDAVHEHEPLLSWGEPPIEEEDETLAPNGNMKKAPAVDAEHEPGIPSYEEVDLDSAALRAQGHEAALKRSFSPLAALGLGFSITNSWVGYLSCFGQNLVYGGPQSVVFGLLVATVVQWIITLGLSEVASAFPSSGGQYHFVFILAPRRHKQFAAFVVGWMTLLGWWIVTCSGISLCVVTVAGMINFWNNDFRATQWQLYLIYLATVFITSAPLFLCPRLVPKITQATLFLSVLGFLVSFALVIGLKKHTQSSSFITQPGLGTSGWRSGTAWVIGLGNAMYAYGGTDGAIHIAEEIPQPGRKVPQVMNLTMLIGFLTAFPLSVAMMYGVTDINAVVKSGLPSAEVFYQVTGRKPVVTFMMCWIILIYYSCLTSQWVTAGRMTWAFARDHGIPFSAYFTHVSPKHASPTRATFLSLLFCSIYGLLYLASTTAFNSIVTSAVLYLNITYAIPQAILLLRGRSKSLPAHRPFHLGRLGYVCNALTPLLVTVIVVFICFPPQLPVTVGNMNYTPVILVGLFGVILAFWFTTGRRFMGPKIDWELLGVRLE
ncbi:MAG: choline transporter [Lasallia pustulata]|uniref:Choline transporter n=1 Tax=Lasallia pustulata TaxID=136370 RepID=A0A5M8PZ59_9LECA|nr:MAG: choline transporter [Lasallia pustulata]